MELNDQQKRAIAAANLSVFDMVISPEDGSAVMLFPKSIEEKTGGNPMVAKTNPAPAIVQQSLSVLGIAIPPLEFQGRVAMTVTLKPDDVQKLVDAGVSTPALDALRGRKSAVQQHLG